MANLRVEEKSFPIRLVKESEGNEFGGVGKSSVFWANQRLAGEGSSEGVANRLYFLPELADRNQIPICYNLDFEFADLSSGSIESQRVKWQLRAVSSVGLERHVDIVEVVGSNPIPPTQKKSKALDLERFRAFFCWSGMSRCKFLTCDCRGSQFLSSGVITG